MEQFAIPQLGFHYPLVITPGCIKLMSVLRGSGIYAMTRQDYSTDCQFIRICLFKINGSQNYNIWNRHFVKPAFRNYTFISPNRGGWRFVIFYQGYRSILIRWRQVPVNIARGMFPLRFT